MAVKEIYKNIIGKPLCLYRRRNFNHKITHINRIDIELVANCNLNCKGCNHFSPLADKKEIDIAVLKDELSQLCIKLGDYFDEISLLGGEPLLHSDICGCIQAARKAIGEKRLVMVTNGILLPNQKDEFWKIVHNCNVVIEITKYPIKIPYDEIEKKAQNNGVALKYFGRSGYVQKTQYSLPLDLSGKQNPKESFQNCFMARQCYTLRNDVLYPCPIAACIERFNSAFASDIPLTPADGGNIYTETAEQILDKLSFPIPMCAYCKSKDRTYGNKWGRSERMIDEWS